LFQLMSSLLVFAVVILAADPTAAACRFEPQREKFIERTAGPVSLHSLECVHARSINELDSASVLAPDHTAIAYLDRDRLLRIEDLNTDKEPMERDARAILFGRFGTEDGGISHGDAPFAWTADSQSIWMLQGQFDPHGFAASPPVPVLVSREGKTVERPLDLAPTERLDAMFWLGHDGIGLAQVNTKGGFYRPERGNPDPSLAIVDAAHGKVLDRLPLSSIEALRDKLASSLDPYVRIYRAAGVVLPDGKVKALINVGDWWIVWTQGAQPLLLQNPYGEKAGTQFALSADGQRVLIANMLQPLTVICEHFDPCPQPTASASGVVMALHDLQTGQAIWSISATINNPSFFAPGTPVISPDGRYAVVDLPLDGTPSKTGIYAMADGELLQQLPRPGLHYSAGFINDGHSLWTHAYNVLATYDRIAGR
jgi:hypothetical protein